MPYVICNNNNYLGYGEKNILRVVNSLDESYKWKTIDKAQHVIRTLPKRFAKYHLDVKYASQENKKINPVAEPVELQYDIIDKVKEVTSFAREIENRRLYLMEVIHNADLEISDIEHAAEFYVLNAVQGYKLYKMLHESRVKRRKYKDELQRINLLLGTSIKSKNLENLESSINGIENKKYTPRVYLELFKM